MIFINNKYSKYYYFIIDNAKSRINKPKTYLENHHIIPESFFINRSRKGPAGWVEGNPEDKTNKVKLTAHEHYVCHLLLVRMTEGQARSKMANALNRIATKNKSNEKVKITGRMYAIIKQELSKANSGEGNPMYGKTGELAPCYGRTGDKHPNFGKKMMSKESNEARREKLTGVPKSAESNKKRSESLKGGKRPYAKNFCDRLFNTNKHPSQLKKTCTHCGITCSANMYSRYHGDNCDVVKPRALQLKKTCPHCNILAAPSQYSRYHGNNCKSLLSSSSVHLSSWSSQQDSQ